MPGQVEAFFIILLEGLTVYIWQPFEARIIETVGNVLCNRRGTSLESAEKFSSPRMISLLRLVCFEPRLDPGWKRKLF